MNWRDLFLTYVIAWALFILIVIFSIAALLSSMALTDESATPYIVFGVIYGIPLLFYFWRNTSLVHEAAAICFVFGTTLIPLLLLVIYAFYSVIFFILQSGSVTSNVSWAFLVSELMMNGVLVLIYGMAIWFVTNEIFEEKEYRPVRDNLKEDYKNFLNSFGKPKKYYRKRRVK